MLVTVTRPTISLANEETADGVDGAGAQMWVAYTGADK